jgi:moderate conductance mechanosensitive channel
MSSLFSLFSQPPVSTALYVVVILFAALLVNRLLRALTETLVKPAATGARVAQAREQQTRNLARVLYMAASIAVWLIALLTALDKVGVNPAPALLIGGLCAVAVGFGAQNTVRDVLSGFFIALEDQYGVGDTVQVGETTGRVEHLTLRRTVLRDQRGALVTIANGEVRSVANLSRDWSQTFVDVELAPGLASDKAMQALEAAAAEMRSDAAWSQALVDGPRILGVQSLQLSCSVIRLQLRTAPTRQEEVARELRRRIQIEFQRRGLAGSVARRPDLAGASEEEAEQPQALS